jgi:ATP-binding cassette subfamily B protein
VIFLSYLKSGFRPVRNFAKYTARLAKASAAAERVLEILDREPEIAERPDARTAAPFAGGIRFEHADFLYDERAPVLRDINFSVEPGEHIAVVGASGIGKSTLMAALPRLHDPAAGRVLIDGEDIRAFTLESLRGQIVIVLQESILFTGTVRDNIGLGRPNTDAEEIERVAGLANAHDFILDLPDGYDTVVGERGETLSAGQRQRIAIARAALRSAPIVILDEPLTGLDKENARTVRSALDRLTRDRTCFLITHDLKDAARCDRILVLADNGVAQFGSHAELLHQGGAYAESVRASEGADPSDDRKRDALTG